LTDLLHAVLVQVWQQGVKADLLAHEHAVVCAVQEAVDDGYVFVVDADLATNIDPARGTDANELGI